MSSLPNWNPELCVGNRQIDDQHRRLLLLGVQALGLLKEDSSMAQFHVVLNDLADLARKHFADEEQVLARNHCPSLEEHKAEHAAYLELLTEVCYQGTQHHPDRAGLERIVCEYLNHHVSETDMKCKAFMKDKPGFGG